MVSKRGRDASESLAMTNADAVASCARPLVSLSTLNTHHPSHPNHPRNPETPMPSSVARSSSCRLRHRKTFAPESRSSSCGANGRVARYSDFARYSSSRVEKAPDSARDRSSGCRVDKQVGISRKDEVIKQMMESVQDKIDSQVKSYQEQIASQKQYLEKAVRDKVAYMINEKTSNMTLSLLNYGTSWDLTRLKGVDSRIAAKIIDYRQRFGSFNSIRDVLAVNELSEEAKSTLGANDEARR